MWDYVIRSKSLYIYKMLALRLVLIVEEKQLIMYFIWEKWQKEA
jgi:hypothetical protein